MDQTDMEPVKVNIHDLLPAELDTYQKNTEETTPPILSDEDNLAINKYSVLRNNILTKLIIPSYYDDIEDRLKWRYLWRKIGNVTFALSKFFIAINALLSFASLTFDLVLLTFMAGCVSVFSLVLLHFSTFSFGRSKEATTETNQILSTLHMGKIPDLISTTEQEQKQAENKKKIKNKQDLKP